jgi:hypothetical protein
MCLEETKNNPIRFSENDIYEKQNVKDLETGSYVGYSNSKSINMEKNK